MPGTAVEIVGHPAAIDALGTVIGDFELDEDAQARSGIGLAARSRASLPNNRARGRLSDDGGSVDHIVQGIAGLA